MERVFGERAPCRRSLGRHLRPLRRHRRAVLSRAKGPPGTRSSRHHPRDRSEPAHQSRDRPQGARGQRGAPRRPPLRSSLRPGRAAPSRRAAAVARARARPPAHVGAGIRCDGRSGGLPRREAASAEVARPRGRGAGLVAPGADATRRCVSAGDRRSTSATRGSAAADRPWRGRRPHRRADLAAAAFVGGRDGVHRLRGIEFACGDDVCRGAAGEEMVASIARTARSLP